MMRSIFKNNGTNTICIRSKVTMVHVLRSLMVHYVIWVLLKFTDIWNYRYKCYCIIAVFPSIVPHQNMARAKYILTPLWKKYFAPFTRSKSIYDLKRIIMSFPSYLMIWNSKFSKMLLPVKGVPGKFLTWFLKMNSQDHFAWASM